MGLSFDRLEGLGFVVEIEHANNDVFGPGHVNDQRDPINGCSGDMVTLFIETWPALDHSRALWKVIK